MATELEVNIPIPTTLKEKLVFYTTAFFLLLGIFSAFGFLFLVPFIIEPAYTTIKMDFDLQPAHCITASIHSRRGLSNCTWTSCREGCTREVYECTQILVNYMHPNIPNSIVLQNTNVEEEQVGEGAGKGDTGGASAGDYDEDMMMFEENQRSLSYAAAGGGGGGEDDPKKYKWFYEARLFPNVKGCGYPPYLNCTLFNNTYVRRGTNFSCYYSRADPSLVVSELDMRQVRLNLICALAVPIISFTLSVIYLTFAYFCIYKEDASKASEKSTPCRQKLKAAVNGIGAAPATTIVQATTPVVPPPTSDILTPSSDLFGEDMDSLDHQYRYAMVDDMLSRDSLDSLAFNYSSSMNGNLNKMMTTCILTPPGPIAQL